MAGWQDDQVVTQTSAPAAPAAQPPLDLSQAQSVYPSAPGVVQAPGGATYTAAPGGDGYYTDGVGNQWRDTTYAPGAPVPVATVPSAQPGPTIIAAPADPSIAPGPAAPTWQNDQVVARSPAPPVIPQRQPGLPEDLARSAWGGLLSGGAQLADTTNAGTAGMGGIETGLDLAGQSGPAQALRQAAPDLADRVAPVGGSYVPTTTAGRYTHSIAQMAPNAVLGPEGLLPRVAAAVVPGVLSEGAADATGALGGDSTAQGAARFIGGMAGSGLLRPKIPQVGAVAQDEAPAARAVQAALDVTGAHRDDVRAAMSGGALPAAASPGLSQLAEAVATLPGEGRAQLEAAAADRMGSQPERAMTAMHDTLGIDPQTARGNVDAIVAQGRANADPQYTAIRANPAPVWNTELAGLAERPAIKKALGVVANNMLNSGQNPTVAGIKLDPDTGAWVMPDGGGIGQVVEQQPTASTWIRVHQALGQTVERNPTTGRVLPNSQSPGNVDIQNAGNALKDALVKSVPGYGDALATSGDYLSTDSAFNRASGKLFNGSVYDFNNMWSSLGSPAEKQAARSALANDVLEKADKGQFLPGQFKSSGVQQKLTTAFGPTAAQNFVDQMESDAGERQVYNNILSNSRTAGRGELVANLKANQPKPTGIRGVGANAAGLMKWGAAITHPPVLIPMLAEKVMRGGAPKETPLPWQDPATSATLGRVLTDRGAMSGLLSRMGTQQNATIAAKRLRIPQLAARAITSGALASGSNAEARGQRR